MKTITLGIAALVQVREALKLTPQRDRDTAWSEAWGTVRDALADSFDADAGNHKGTSE